MRVLLPLLVMAVFGGGCNPVGTPAVETRVDGAGVQLQRLNDAVDAVATEQREADPALSRALTVVQQMDEYVADFRDPDTVDAAKERWQPMGDRLAEVDLDAAQTQFREVAFAVDDARSQVRRARDTLADDWEQRYLDAQGEVLTAVRRYAEAADALTQVLAHHWDTYTRLSEITATFVEQRWFYRTSEEAAAAYDVEIGRLFDDLRLAQRQIAEFRQQRDEAATAVNDATDEAAAVWAQRPAD